MSDKVGLNDQCPCGSGQKYKKCCLGKDDLVSLKTATRADLDQFLNASETCFVCNKPVNVYSTSGIGDVDFEADGVVLNWDGALLASVVIACRPRAASLLRPLRKGGVLDMLTFARLNSLCRVEAGDR